jgi:hypothetical protein
MHTLPATVGLGTPNQLVRANNQHLIKQSLGAAQRENQWEQSLTRGPAPIPNAPDAQRLAMATQGMTLDNILQAVQEYQNRVGVVPTPSASCGSAVSGAAPMTMEEEFASQSNHMRTALHAAIGDDYALLEANNAMKLLPQSKFGTHEQQSLQNRLYRQAHHQSMLNPDSTLTYMGTLSAAGPTLQQTIANTRVANTIQDAQLKLGNHGEVNVRQGLIPATPVPQINQCMGESIFLGQLGKTLAQAQQLGPGALPIGSGLSYGKNGVTDSIMYSAMLGQQLQ